MARNKDDSNEDSIEALVESIIQGQPRVLEELVERINAGDSLALDALVERAKKGDPVVFMFDALVERAKKGDPAALAALVAHAKKKAEDRFETLFSKYSPEIRSFIIKDIHDQSYADNLTLDTFFNVWRGLPTFNKTSSFRTWLYKIAHNVVIDFIRKHKRTPPSEEGNSTEVGNENTNPEEEIIEKENEEEIIRRIAEITRQVLEGFPEKYQQCYQLYIIQKLSKDDVANKLSITPGSVGVYISKVRKALYEALKQEFGKTLQEPLKQKAEKGGKGDEFDG